MLPENWKTFLGLTITGFLIIAPCLMIIGGLRLLFSNRDASVPHLDFLRPVLISHPSAPFIKYGFMILGVCLLFAFILKASLLLFLVCLPFSIWFYQVIRGTNAATYKIVLDNYGITIEGKRYPWSSISEFAVEQKLRLFSSTKHIHYISTEFVGSSPDQLKKLSISSLKLGMNTGELCKLLNTYRDTWIEKVPN